MIILDSTNEFIFTSQSGSEDIARNEIAKISTDSSFLKRIDNGVELIKISESFSDFFKKLNGENLIFVRHLQPVTEKIQVSENLLYDLIQFVEKSIWLFENLDKKRPFSVQTRIFDKNSSTNPFEVNNILSNILKEKGYILDINKPSCVLSILIDSNTCYIGLSEVKHNLSNWAGGNIRFKKDNTISRAEFKLLEAFSIFPLNLHGGLALDLGAAPGGWTKVLIEKNYEVISVDPADLKISNEKITHEKMTAQKFFETNKKTFDIIVNDMKMDIMDSIDIIIMAEKFLNDNGIIVMTLKLPNKSKQKNTYKSINVLKKHFKILGARQLFHNRSEVTVLLLRDTSRTLK